MSTTVVLGAGGLLGAEVRRATAGSAARPIRWAGDQAHDDLAAAARDLAAADRPVRVAWCAGAGIVGSTEAALDRENDLLDSFLTALSAASAPVEALFVASSAGGVYAASPVQVIDERTAAAPLSAYGRGKLRQEGTALRWSARTGVPVAIGRLSNLYGPGQKLAKQQGLLSMLVRASLLRQPLPIYVDLDTRRDYLYAADAGRLVGVALDEVAATGTSAVRILASGRSTTVGEVVHELERIRKSRVLAVYARTALSGLQPRSLAFTPAYREQVHRTPFTVGLAAVLAAQLRSLQAGHLR